MNTIQGPWYDLYISDKGLKLKNLSDIINDSTQIGLVVAHPDDEVFFFSNLLILYGAQVQIYCVTDGNYDNNGPRRMSQINKVSLVLTGKEVVCLGFADHPDHDLDIEIISEALKKTKLKNDDFIVTHAPHGDYGHLNHRDSYFSVVRAFPDKMVLFCADYVIPDFELKLEASDFIKKQNLFFRNYFDEYRQFWKYRR
jgi:LmbE family N-acetylglucosaminyl deacetylase